jgi:hypothetical protein
MTERRLQVAHIVVRVVSSLTLAASALSLVSDKYYPSASRSFANSFAGTATILWMTVTSLLLPAFVGLETWWARRLNLKNNSVYIDAILAAACLALFLVVVIVGFTHYAIL